MAQNGCVKREINVYLAYGNVIKRRIVLMALTRKIVVSGDRDVMKIIIVLTLWS